MMLVRSRKLILASPELADRTDAVSEPSSIQAARFFNPFFLTVARTVVPWLPDIRDSLLELDTRENLDSPESRVPLEKSE
mmetsp:Transcript_11344/g.31921  ORF Transcript_11344/g.31921 Transcript_11344/m.31921 type:complete len:80 (+) Transcript_11344:504-743(+)